MFVQQSGPDAAASVFRNELMAFLRERPEFLSGTGAVNIAAFARQLAFSYESLRGALTGYRPPSVGLIENCAEVLRVEPIAFSCYTEARPRRRQGTGPAKQR